MTRRGIYILSLGSPKCTPLKPLASRLQVDRGVNLVDLFLVLKVSYGRISCVLVVL